MSAPLLPLPSRPTVGFDLDMTLIDPRQGIRSAYARLSSEFGIDLDPNHFAENLGPPIADALREYGLHGSVVHQIANRFREIYPELVVPSAESMPGAATALRGVRAHGGRTLVVTGKYEPNAERHLSALGWTVDRLAGDVFAAAKGAVLRAEGASVYVGDHVGDVEGARAAGALAVTVATGPCSTEQLRASGADVVLPDLTAFEDWLDAQFGTDRAARAT